MGKKYRVSIIWSDSLTLEEVLTKKDPDDKGVYQLYGPHRLYRAHSDAVDQRRVLLYIGRTTDSFGNRWASHINSTKLIGTYIEEVTTDEDDFRVRVGKIRVLEGQKNVTDSLIKDVETALIRTYQPALNSMNTSERNKGRRVVIQHRGKRNTLSGQCSVGW